MHRWFARDAFFFASAPANIPITNRYDFNRDAKVDPTDVLAARNNSNAVASAPRFINIALAALASPWETEADEPWTDDEVWDLLLDLD